MLYRPKPPLIDAYQFHKDWENDKENWLNWMPLLYNSGQIIKVNDSRVIAAIDNKAIFTNDYVYITEDGVKVIPEKVFESKYELVA